MGGAEEPGGEAREGDVEVDDTGAGGDVVDAHGGGAEDLLDLAGREAGVGLQEKGGSAGDDGCGLGATGPLHEARSDDRGRRGILGGCAGGDRAGE